MLDLIIELRALKSSFKSDMVQSSTLIIDTLTCLVIKLHNINIVEFVKFTDQTYIFSVRTEQLDFQRVI